MFTWRVTGRWTYSSVRDVLTDPKYTGHMVRNRRARRAPARPARPRRGGMPDEVSRQLFEALRLEMTYDHKHHQVAARITLTGDAIDTVSRTTAAVAPPFRPRAAQPADEPNPRGSAWCPQRDSNPCRRLERAVS